MAMLEGLHPDNILYIVSPSTLSLLLIPGFLDHRTYMLWLRQHLKGPSRNPGIGNNDKLMARTMAAAHFRTKTIGVGRFDPKKLLMLLMHMGWISLN
eukprot:1902401-Heterocapsa_arctica.AAC.1